jgi:hypothetical protein
MYVETKEGWKDGIEWGFITAAVGAALVGLYSAVAASVFGESELVTYVLGHVLFGAVLAATSQPYERDEPELHHEDRL